MPAFRRVGGCREPDRACSDDGEPRVHVRSFHISGMIELSGKKIHATDRLHHVGAALVDQKADERLHFA